MSSVLFTLVYNSKCETETEKLQFQNCHFFYQLNTPTVHIKYSKEKNKQITEKEILAVGQLVLLLV